MIFGPTAAKARHSLQRHGVPADIIIWVLRFRREDLREAFRTERRNALRSVSMIVHLHPLLAACGDGAAHLSPYLLVWAGVRTRYDVDVQEPQCF